MKRRRSQQATPWPQFSRPVQHYTQLLKQQPSGTLVNAAAVTAIGVKRTVNQDRAILEESVQDNVLIGVFDGHGQFGHMAAEFCAKVFPPTFATNLLDEENVDNVISQSIKKVNSMLLEVSEKQKKLLHPYIQEQTKIAPEKTFLWEFGTTANVCCISDNTMYFGNVGDSRIVVFHRLNSSETWQTLVPLPDHNPTVNEAERDRVEADGGRLLVRNGYYRVLAPISDNTSNPSLGMTRSLGHINLRKFGVSGEAECTTMKINKRREYLIVCATDGVWDVLTQDDVLRIVAVSPDDPGECCRMLLEASCSSWESYGNLVGDNVSAVVANVKHSGGSSRQKR